LLLRVGVALAVICGAFAVAYATVPTTWKANDPLKAVDLNGNFSALDQRIAALEAQLAVPNNVPVGTIVPFGGVIDANPDAVPAPTSPPPSGWLLCNGDSLNGLDTRYVALYKAIKTSFGGISTSMSFNLPDLRGRFLRGVDGTAGRDKDATDTGRPAMNTGGNVGNRVGSIESDTLLRHNHGGITGDDAPDHTHGYARPVGGSWGGGSGSLVSMGGDAGETTGGASVRHQHSIAWDGTGAETRPLNANVNWIIKY
jgi:microcystin-dependent protein